MATRYLDFKSTDSIRDVNLGTNLFPQRLCHRRSHVVIPSLKAGILLPYLDIFGSDSCPCWQKRALSLPNDIQNAPAYIVSQNSMQISHHTSGSHIAAPFHPIRDSSLTVLEREQAEAAAARVPTPISFSPLSKRWWPSGEKDGRMVQAIVVCCERDNICCDSTHTSTIRARYVRFSFPVAYPLPLPVECRVPLNGVHCRQCNLPPNIRLAVDAVSVQRSA